MFSHQKLWKHWSKIISSGAAMTDTIFLMGMVTGLASTLLLDCLIPFLLSLLTA